MRQYREMKAAAPDTILLFRVGDFYETFDADAELVSRELGITLTRRNNGGDMTPLAGFPFHAVDTYLPKLVRKGHRVAVCEQTEDPEQARKAGKKIVTREITEITTPGVTLSDLVLDRHRNNYILSVVLEGRGDRRGSARGEAGVAGIAFADVSTGEFALCEVDPDALSEIRQLLQPAEVLLEQSMRRSPPKALTGLPAAGMEAWIYEGDAGYQRLKEHFGTHSLKGFGVEELATAHKAGGALLEYLRQTQKTGLLQIRGLSRFERESFMSLDPATKRNLELSVRASDGEEEGSLVSILDHTRTAMGSRLLRRWIMRPLRHSEAIRARLDAVDTLFRDHGWRRELRSVLSQLGDMERLIARISSGRCSPRDLGALRASLEVLPGLKALLTSRRDEPSERVFAPLAQRMDDHAELLDSLRRHLRDDLPQTIRDGGVIREGMSDELDELRTLSRDSKQVMAAMRDELVRQTGISSLKLGYNRVFGYYIEITKARREPIPEHFIRKQTLVNAERYITPELKELEERILTAEERSIALEEELFEQIRRIAADSTGTIQPTAAAIAELDVYQGLAEAAFTGGYVRPEVDESTIIEIVKGRHPVVERLLGPETPFIPNDVRLDSESDQILIITGPNMAGKSVILRQTGLITLMAQIGSFVPAQSARIGVVDKIFTRVGASDNLSGGESTFLVEMNETASILHNATPRSLILLDEIGRGTSTFDGLSIAWSLAEYLHNEPTVAAKTLFATHYHELNDLADRYERIRNVSVSVKEHAGEVIFLRKLVPGGSDHSYGIQVAALAGLPARLLERAREVLGHLEDHTLEVGGGMGLEQDASPSPSSSPSPSARKISTAPIQAYPAHPQMMLFAAERDPSVEQVMDRLQAVDPDRLTPIEALVLVGELRRLLGDRSGTGARNGSSAGAGTPVRTNRIDP